MIISHHITSHGEDGRRPEGLYIRKIHFNTFIYTLTLIYNTAVFGTKEINFVVITHFLIWPEFVKTMFKSVNSVSRYDMVRQTVPNGYYPDSLVKLNFLKS